MFRVTVVSIVLTLVVGPNAGVLCKAWCDPAEAAATQCHHERGSLSATLSGTDDCGREIPDSAVVVNDDARRGAPSSDALRAVMAPQHHRAIPSSEAHAGNGAASTWFLVQRPHVIALRI